MGVHCYVLLVFLLLCSCYVTDLIKKLELHLLVVIILFKIEFGHAQITVRKIGTLMLKTACINPWLELASEFGSDLQDAVDWGRKWLVDFNTGKTQLISFDRSSNTGAIDVKIDGFALEEKSSGVDFLF